MSARPVRRIISAVVGAMFIGSTLTTVSCKLFDGAIPHDDLVEDVERLAWIIRDAQATCLVIGTLVCGCSNNPSGADGIATLTVYPASGPPGTVVRISGLDEAKLSGMGLEASIGGKTAPVIMGESGQLLAAVPLFLDASGRPAPPAGPQDVRIPQSADDWPG